MRGLIPISVTLLLAAGCSGPPIYQGALGPNGAPIIDGVATATSNTLLVAQSDREFVFNQLVDAIDDDFRIRYEQRVRVLEGGVLTEGSVVTYPLAGATMFEPWRGDSTPGFERLQSTLQSIRRRVEARMIPSEGGYLIEVSVFKELEDLSGNRTAATPGSLTQRHDTGIVRRDEGDVLAPDSNGWIPIGRDLTLEQQILADLRSRLVDNVSTQLVPVSVPAPFAAPVVP